MADVNITVDANTRQAERSLSQFERKVGDVEKSTGGLNNALGLSEGAFQLLQAAAVGVGAAFGAMKVAQVAYEMAEVGAAADRMGASLDAITGGKADEYIAAVGEASLNTISQMDAMTLSARALRLGVVENSADMARLTEVAAALGRTMGLSTTQALNDLTTGIGRLSPMILDNLGITIKLEDAYADYALQIGKSAEELTKAEQQQAVLNVVLAEGSDIIEDMGGLTQDAAGDMEAFEAAMADAKLAAQRLASDAISPLAGDLAVIIRYLQEGTSASGDFSEAMWANYRAQNALLGPVHNIAEGIRVLNQRAEDAAPDMEMLERRVHDFGRAASDAEEPTDALADAEQRLAAASGEEARRTQEAWYAIEDKSEAEQAALDAAKEYADAQRDIARALEDQRKAHQNNIGVAGELQDAYINYGAALSDTEMAGQAWLSFLEDSGALTGASRGEIDQLYLSLGLATEQEIAMAGGMDALSQALSDGTLDIEEATELWKDFVAAGGDRTVIDTAIETEQRQQAVIDKLSGTGLEMGNMAGAAEDARDTVVMAADEQALAIQNGPLAATLDMQTALETVQVVGPEAMADVAAAAEENVGPLRTVAGVVQGIRNDWKWLLDHPTVNLTANVSGSGSGLVAPAGGANFVTSGPTLMMVGDNPGGREHVQVTPLSGRGITRGLSFAGGGNLTTGGPAPGGIVVNIYGPVGKWAAEDIARELYPALEQESARLGRRAA